MTATLTGTFRPTDRHVSKFDLQHNPELVQNVLATVESMLENIQQHKDEWKEDEATRRYDMCSAKSTFDQSGVSNFNKESCGGGRVSRAIQTVLEARGISHSNGSKRGPGTFSFSWEGDNLKINYHGHSRVTEEIEGELRVILEQLIVDVKEAAQISDPDAEPVATAGANDLRMG
jgi:hypothetical protein